MDKDQAPTFQYCSNSKAKHTMAMSWETDRLRWGENRHSFLKRKDIHQIPASRSMAHIALCALLSMGLSIPGGILSLCSLVLCLGGYCQWRDMRIRSTVNVLVPYFEVTLDWLLLNRRPVLPSQLLSTNLVLGLVLPFSWCCCFH